jgi:hypothetical protein
VIEVPRSIETLNKIPDCIASLWNETRKEAALFPSGGGETNGQDAVRGARLTIETGAEVPNRINLSL